MLERPSRLCKSGRKTLPNVREWSDSTPGCLGLIGKPSWMSGSVRKALPDVRELWGDPPRCPCGVGGPSRCPVVVGRPSQMCGRPSRLSGSGWETFLDFR